MSLKFRQKDRHEMQAILELTYSNLAEAFPGAEKMLEKFKSDKLNYGYAKAQLLYLTVTVAVMDKRYKEIDAEALWKYFETNGYEDEAAQTLLLLIKCRYGESNYEEAKALDGKFDELYAGKMTIRMEVTSLITKANFYLRDHNKTGQLELALKAEALLRAAESKDAWYRCTLSMVLQIKAKALSATKEEKKVIAAIEEAKQLVDTPSISPHFYFLAFYYHASILYDKRMYEEVIDIFNSIEKRLTGNAFFEHLLLNVYSTKIDVCTQIYERSNNTDKKKKELLAEQLRCLQRLDAMPQQNIRPALRGYLLLSRAKVLRLQGNFKEPIKHLAKALRIFSKHNFAIHIMDVYGQAALCYEERAVQEKRVDIMRKAVNAMKLAQRATFIYNEVAGKEKMDAIINSYELKQKELTEKILEQKVEAMNQEIKMVNMNLFEKVKVLDNLKKYIATLRKKGQEADNIIKKISKEIDDVIMTEQEKSTILQKMEQNNSGFFKLLSERHPSLSLLEVSTCGLLKTGMTNKELSRIYGQSAKSYEQHRYRIKKKLNLGAKDNLVKYLLSLEA